MTMIRKCILAGALFGLISCQSPHLKGVDSELIPAVEIALSQSGDNREQLERALIETNLEIRNGMAFLIANMPESDLDTLSADFLVEQVALAYKTKELFSWTRELPDSIFLNEVLPYASMDETRENWREPLFEMLYPLVKDCKDIYAAIDTVNRSLAALVTVEYNTKRRKANQSPSESMEINMASCSGLSILLTDAFRAVGIPSRIGSAPLWVSKEGNHSWSEVWIDGKWYFTEYYPEALNRSWFLYRAGAADKSNPIHWIYASSFKKTDLVFPLIWDDDNKEISGVDVTDRYINLYKEQQAVNSTGVDVSIRLYKDEASKTLSEGRIQQTVIIRDADGEIISQGKTASSTADMNDYLTVRLPELSKCTVEYQTDKGTTKKEISINKEEMVVELFYTK